MVGWGVIDTQPKPWREHNHPERDYYILKVVDEYYFYNDSLSTSLPRPSLPPRGTISMTTTHIFCPTYPNNISCYVFSRLCTWTNTPNFRILCNSVCYDSMIPRRICRRCVPRKSHICCTKGTNTWCCSIYC